MNRIAVAVIGLCLSGMISAFAVPGLKVTFTTVAPPGGSWGTKYAVALWIKSAAGTFIKTFGIWGKDRNANDLPLWNGDNGGVKTVDGVTGATSAADTTLFATWNLTGNNGALVSPGDYWYKIEINNKHTSLASYTGYFVAGKITIDATAKTKTTVDTSINKGSTYITKVIAEYTPAAASVVRDNAASSRQNPLTFLVPATFAKNTITIRFVTPGGRVLWQNRYPVCAGKPCTIASHDITLPGFRGIGILEADFGAMKAAHLYSIVR
jgi:hypothetical protein